MLEPLMEKLVEINKRNLIAAICTGLFCALIYKWMGDANTTLFVGILMYIWFAYLFQERPTSIEDMVEHGIPRDEAHAIANMPKYKGRTMNQDFLNWDSSNEVPPPFVTYEDE